MVSKRTWTFAAALGLIAVIALAVVYGVWQLQPQAESPKTGALFQVSAYYPLSLGNYAGNIAYSDLMKHGDFGIGAFDGMDGEMIALNGNYYQVRTDGAPRAVDPSLKSPFAMVTYFKTDQTIHITEPLNYSQITAYLDSALPTLDGIYAFKISGTYEYAKTRSVPAQTPPYPPLADVIKNQTVFLLSNISGTAVGYRCPSYMNGTDVPGYHLHFITNDRTAGGHLLDCTISNVTMEISYIHTFEMTAPST
jgi:acetolactate decarboxylase